MKRVVIVSKSGESRDRHVAEALEKQLQSSGYVVYRDLDAESNMIWAKGVMDQIQQADVIIPLLSQAAANSEHLAYQIETAHDTAQRHHGRPALIPCLLGWTGPLPEPLGGILSPIKLLLWEEEADTAKLIEGIHERMDHLPQTAQNADIQIKPGLRLLPKPALRPKPIRVNLEAMQAPKGPLPLEPIGGAVPLHSDFYMQREVDREFKEALMRYDSIVLVKGPRQIGKTSLLARGLQLGRERGAKVALTDFQKFNACHLENVQSFYLSLAESLADQLDIDVLPADVWDDRRGPNVNFERYIRREILDKIHAPLIWGLDEVDRLFTCEFGSEVFGLFRSWHNERALDPESPWAGLTLCIAYATEAHLFISDMNQSPFNVGTRLRLDDFDQTHVEELNERYGRPLSGSQETHDFQELLGGHPYLVRRGLHEMASRRISFEVMASTADKDDGLFGDHLRRILVVLARDPALSQVLVGVLNTGKCPDPESFYRLRSAGLIQGTSELECEPRCDLYRRFLKRHLDQGS
jgi:hypothetical protein